MSENLALLVAWLFVAFVLWQERQRKTPVSGALFWPTLWYMVASSRPVGIWFTIWGVPLPGGSAGVEDGSVVERFFYLTLTLIGVRVLNRRAINWERLRRQNIWLVVFVAYMLVSVLWSDYTYISFKRFIKMAGSVVMALVILTEEHQFEAIKAVVRRVFLIHLPMSVLCVKYFRNIGVAFDWSGTAEAWQGISSSKNVLGQVAMVSTLYFIYETIRQWRQKGWRNISVIYILMGGYLLKGSDKTISMTSVSVFVFGLVIFLRLEMLRNRREMIRPFVWKMTALTASLILLVSVHSVVMFSEHSVFGWMITKLGRDITLTDRTTIWSEVYMAASSNPLMGVGFGGFWIGQEANIEFSRRMTWVLGQAHSGYVDTYLQTGWIGIVLMTGTFLAAAKRLRNTISYDFEAGRFKVIIFLTALFVNITETSHLRGDHHLWVLLLLSLIDVSGTTRGQPVSSDADEDRSAPEPVAARRRTVEAVVFPHAEESQGRPAIDRPRRPVLHGGHDDDFHS